MIVFLDGVLEDKEPTRAVVNVGGVGYEAAIPLSSYDRLPAAGQRVRLLTVLVVREDAHLLFGFMTAEERALFLQLTSVNGIGPKLGLAVLSGLSATSRPPSPPATSSASAASPASARRPPNDSCSKCATSSARAIWRRP